MGRLMVKFIFNPYHTPTAPPPPDQVSSHISQEERESWEELVPNT